MKRILPFGVGGAALAAVVFYAAPFQTAPARPLATLAPGGALLYLESPDFARELRDWNQSPEKRTWLAGANYAEFSRSMLFLRLTEEWKAFGGAAGFAAVGVSAVAMGLPYLKNYLPLGQVPGAVSSSGTIALISLLVGIEVAAALVAIIGELLEQTLLVRRPGGTD